MQFEKESLRSLQSLLNRAENQKIVVIAHTNPDGDALGSTLAWARVMRGMGHEVQCVAPNNYPYFMSWMEGIGDYLIHRKDEEAVNKVVAEAEIIFCIDFNSPSRLEGLSDALIANTTAAKVLIDHHLSPDDSFDIIFSYPEESSACFITYSLIVEMWGSEVIDAHSANLLYTGVMTDTGNFAFAKLSPELFRGVATLVERGADVADINRRVFNSYSEDRAKLFGYIINRKMCIIPGMNITYMSLTEGEMRRHKFQQGDSEGFVNYPLTIATMKVSALFVENRHFVRVSLRSRGDVDVNLFARKYFNGGGHRNAAGGKSYLSLNDTIEKFKVAIAEFWAES